VLHQSDAMISFFGQSIEGIIQADMFEVKEVEDMETAFNGQKEASLSPFLDSNLRPDTGAKFETFVPLQ